MIWYDMSYNQFDADFLNKLETEPKENEAEINTIDFAINVKELIAEE